MLPWAALLAFAAAAVAAWPRMPLTAAQVRREAIRRDALDRLLRPRSRSSGWG